MGAPDLRARLSSFQEVPDSELDEALLAAISGGTNRKLSFRKLTTWASVTVLHNSPALDASSIGRLIRCDSTTQAFSVTLPAGTKTGQVVLVSKINPEANRVTVIYNSVELAWLTTQHDSVMFQWTGTQWVDRWFRLAPVETVLTSSGTWVRPPLARRVKIHMVGGGAGGASGRVSAAGTAAFGGGGGGHGSFLVHQFRASELPSSVSYAIGAGGAAGAAVSTPSTNGNAGAGGGNTTWGNTSNSYFRIARGGFGGSGGTTGSGVTGGGMQGTWMPSATGVNAALTGIPATNPQLLSLPGCGGSINASNVPAQGNQSSATQNSQGAFSNNGGAVDNPGLNGFLPAPYSSGVTGTPLAVAASGGGASVTGNGGKGGDSDGANVYGLGGGGGGAARDGFSSGAGGRGAPGVIIVVVFF